jgi:beta-N-acetylhexosaminidase
MRAIADNFGVGDAAVRAVMAGCDALLLCCNRDNQVVARDALLRAGTDRPDVRAGIAEAAARVRALKHAYVPRRAPLDPARARAVLGCADYTRLAERLAGA